MPFFLIGQSGNVSQSQGLRFVSVPGLDISLGPVYGIHPNLRNEYARAYFFVEGKGSVNILNMPFALKYRYSNEDVRFGRASYFKLSFDSEAYRRMHLGTLKTEMDGIDTDISAQNKKIYELQAKLSFLYQKKLEYENKMSALGYKWKLDSLDKIKFPDLNSPDFNFPNDLGIGTKTGLDKVDLKDPNLPTLKLPDLPKVKIPDIPDYKIDSFNLQFKALSTDLDSANFNLDKLKLKGNNLKAEYLSTVNRKAVDFISGIKKMDFGLTSLSKSSMSSNAIPIQGVRFLYEEEKYFVDVAAGFTLPNQLFSNQAFDQIVYNTGNVFNAGNFFQINSMRFVSNANVGWGSLNGNHVAVENYYTGNALSKKYPDNKGRALTSNITSRYTPKSWQNLTWVNTIGYTWFSAADTSKVKPRLENKIALFSSATLTFPSIKSSLTASFRKIPKAYDGWVQGIYLTQTQRTELMYKQHITSRIRAAVRVSSDKFLLGNTLNSNRVINEVGVDVQSKINQHMVAFGNYSLLALRERATLEPRADLSHLAKIGLSTTGNLFKNKLFTNHDFGYAQINGMDSSQLLINVNSRYKYQMRNLDVGIQVNYSDFKGLSRLYGRNFVLQPEIGYRYDHFIIAAIGQVLWSEQFATNFGYQLRLGFAFSDFLDLNFMVQRFLPTEYALFMDVQDENRDPIYMKMHLNIHLGKKRF